MVGPRRMRVLGGVGGVLVCGVAGVTVAAAPKPAGAPLTPPVEPAHLADATASATATAGLVIPATPVCGAATPDQRLQSIAQRRARSRCAPAAPAPDTAAPQPVIQPDVVDAAPSQAPVASSYVS